MAYFSTATAPERRNVIGKNRVWDFFPLSNETHPAKRRQPAQPRRKIRPTPTKSASGIPYWPSRDPVGEDGGENLYGCVRNESINLWDILGTQVKVIYGHKNQYLTDKEFGYYFAVKYDVSTSVNAMNAKLSITDKPIKSKNQVVVANLKFSVKYMLTSDCKEQVDDFHYSEWFRVGTNGQTPGHGSVDAFRNNKMEKKDWVDLHHLGPNDKVCCGTVSVTVEYGLGKPFNEIDEKIADTGQFGLADLGGPGLADMGGSMTGPFSSHSTATDGWKVIPMKLENKIGDWSYTYTFAKGDGCCKTKSKYHEDIIAKGVDGWHP